MVVVVLRLLQMLLGSGRNKKIQHVAAAVAVTAGAALVTSRSYSGSE